MNTTIECQLKFSDIEVHFSNKDHVWIITPAVNFVNALKQANEMCNKNNFTLYGEHGKFRFETEDRVVFFVALSDNPFPVIKRKITNPSEVPNWNPHKDKFIQMVKASHNNKTIKYTENWKFPNMPWSVSKMTC